MSLPNKAFTLIELLIVVSIIAILSSTMIPSFNSYIKSQNLKQAREQIKSDLRSIQTNALTNAAPSGSSLVSPYWGLLFEAGSSSYYYFATSNSSSTVSDCVSSKNEEQKYNLPNNISISGSSVCIIFEPSTGSRPGSSLPVVIKENTSSQYECININSEGLISTGTWDTATNKCND